DALRTLVSSQIASCRLSLHLIGSRYGMVPEGTGETRSVIWLQQEIAAQRAAQEGFHCFLWLPPGTQIKDDRQKNFMNTVQEQLRTRNDFEILQTSLDALKSYIFDKLQAANERHLRKKTSWIYLICEPEDLEAVNPIQQYLEGQGFEV